MTRRRWPKGYAPLRARTLLWQLAVLVAVELALYSSYATHSARFHWATHFLVGLTVASLWRLSFLLVAARPTRFQLLSVLGFHLWAMWPDLAFRAGVPHYRWMDWLALGHVSSHYMPGGDSTWLVIALAAAALYAMALWRWLLARHIEAAAGMSPAFGIGGAAVFRPQRDPASHHLAHRHYRGHGDDGAAPLVLLHGLGGTSATWSSVAGLLEQRGRTVVVPDLLGFGDSRHVGTVFGLDQQADAVIRLLDHHDVNRAHLVGHSWGCAVAAAVARRAPQRVAALTLVTPAIFVNVDAAKRRFAKRSPLARMTVEGAPLGGFACGAMCLARPVLGRLAPRLEPDVPPQVARDGLKHSFAAYADALDSLWTDNPLVAVLRDPPCPTTVVLAEDDKTVLADDVFGLPPSATVDIEQVAGDHSIVYRRPDDITQLLLRQNRSTGPASG